MSQENRRTALPLGRALLAAALLCAPALAGAQERAQEDSYSPAYKTCMDKSGGVTAAMLDCGSAEYAKLDAALNAAYRAATNGLEAEQRNLLRDTQRAWLAYRDSSCSFMSRLGDRGTMASLSDQSCLMRVTAERTRWLKDLAPL
ncbi:lysozyme inhibitor LprI family protein [Bosea sp. (in: a-proteobacteria)]|uniref:lysozyme inhibitor LprI family protein n=1 Tax=Bosea sp. (in: a-proteobacteria) TaxID=1871050 RepID=UPI002FC5FA6C